jgi:sporulation protein YlmC with PRC-barrel domain
MGFNKPTWTPGRDRHPTSDAHFRQLKRLRARGERHGRERIAARELEGSLVSLAALIGSAVKDPDGRHIGELRDVVVNWTAAVSYPRMTAIVMRTGKRDVLIGARWIDVSAPASVRLRSGKAFARKLDRRSGDVALAHDVLDHQIVDRDGTQIVRPSDVYLAAVDGRVELIGIEVGLGALLRRLGPKRLRGRVRPQRVIDWGSIHGFAPRPGEDERAPRSRTAVAGRPGAGIELDGTAAAVKLMRPTETQSALRRAGTGRGGDAS